MNSHQTQSSYTATIRCLTTSLTHEIETALVKGMTATIFTLDIKGAFDAVLPGRFVRRLREQGWPAQLCS